MIQLSTSQILLSKCVQLNKQHATSDQLLISQRRNTAQGSIIFDIFCKVFLHSFSQKVVVVSITYVYFNHVIFEDSSAKHYKKNQLHTVFSLFYFNAYPHEQNYCYFCSRVQRYKQVRHCSHVMN